MIKNYLLLILVFTSFAYSEQITENKIQKKTITTSSSAFILKYNLALDHFKKKDYEQSYTILHQLFQTKSDDININFNFKE